MPEVKTASSGLSGSTALAGDPNRSSAEAARLVSGYRVPSHLAHSEPTVPEGALSWLRQLCLFVSSAILQFPAMFEMQQRALNQPTLLRGAIEKELNAITASGGSFRILDYGCGSGTYAGLIESGQYIGVDCSAPMIERARQLHPGHRFVEASDLSQLQESVENVSHVFMIGVVHHLSALQLAQIFSELPPGQTVRLLTIDTLKCDTFPGNFVQLFERGEYLRDEKDHLSLMCAMAEQISYEKVPYGSCFDLAVFRGIVHKPLS